MVSPPAPPFMVSFPDDPLKLSPEDASVVLVGVFAGDCASGFTGASDVFVGGVDFFGTTISLADVHPLVLGSAALANSLA